VMKASTFVHQIQIFWDVYTEIVHVVWLLHHVIASACSNSCTWNQY
jgi:hypothetical protein